MSEDYLELLTSAAKEPETQTDYLELFEQSLTAPHSAPQIPIGKPTISSDNSSRFGFSDHLRANLATDTETQIKRYSEMSGLPTTAFGTVDGEIVFWNGEQYQKVVPDVGPGRGVMDKFRRLGEVVASGTPDTIPGVVSGAAGAAMGPTGASIPAAAVVASSTEWARQALDKMLAGETLEDFDLGNIAFQGAVGGLGQGASVGVSKAMHRNILGVERPDRAEAVSADALAKWTALNQEAQRRGIDLSAHQITGLRSLGVQERNLGRYAETTDDVAAFRDRQHDQVERAFIDEVDNISTVRGEAGVSSIRQGANDVRGDLLAKRSKEANAAYGAALDDKPPFFDERLRVLFDKPDFQEAWKRAKKANANDIDAEPLPEIFIEGPDGSLTMNTEVVPSWRAWDKIKRSLDDVIDSHSRKDASGRVIGYSQEGNSAKNLKNYMLKILDEANPDYAQARALYGEASETLDAILSGGIGVINNIRGLDSPAAIKKIFNANNVPPSAIREARQAFTSIGKKDQWDAGVATWLVDRLEDQIGQKGNLAAGLEKTIWRHPRTHRLLVEAIGDADRVDGMKKLMQVLSAAAKGLPEGSPTATDLGTNAGGLSRGVKFVGAAVSPQTYMELGNKITGAIEALMEPGARRKLAQTLLRPESLDDLKKLKPVSTKSETALRIAADIMTKAGVISGGSAMTVPADQRAADELQSQDPLLGQR